jgi:hypothetical protein
MGLSELAQEKKFFTNDALFVSDICHFIFRFLIIKKPALMLAFIIFIDAKYCYALVLI